ncbi:uncharacterized protein EAF02_000247 [Botrytis sinoallii]|uniref:uncharacterized protein n=1 Tax=Botrytis sinoallii TaxID=1463999 RepID=UPI0019015F97|nr:uncharacterized protein EAF02_000247 [Botrytis sinoallii]KAF7892709.1 hypothetical protein EAF02_000247 [Botrytis sinoallii]
MASTSSEENLPSPKAGYWRYYKPRLLIDMLDERARVCPDALFGGYPMSILYGRLVLIISLFLQLWFLALLYQIDIHSPTRYRKITYAQLANVVNGAARFLTEKCGPGKDFQTLCYMGWNDFRYVIFILGAVKAGYKLLLTSPLLAASATTHLFTTMSCKVLLTTSPQPPTVAPVVKLHDYLLISNHDFAAAYVRALQLEPPEGFESLDRKSEGGRVFSLTAPFHTSAICVMIAAIANQTTYIFPPAATIPTAALAVEGLKHTNDVVVADCAKNSELLDFFASHVGLMCYGGGDVAQALGDIVSTKLDLYTSHGSTEFVNYPLVREIGDREPKDWRYFHAHPAAGLQFRLHPEGENLHEAYIVRNPNLRMNNQTKDLYSPHPSEPDLWIYKMRSDDMIPLSNGQIANPSIMEHAVLDCTGIKEAVVLPVQKIGLENYITCITLLIEPASKVLSTEQKDDLIKELWPIVEKTNSYYRTNAFVEKKRILFVDPRKPLARTAKGTISRKMVLEDYKEEVDKLT